MYVGLYEHPDLEILTVGIIDFTDDMATFLILKEGVIRFARFLTYNDTADEYSEKSFADELYRSVEYYQNHYKEKPARLIITGKTDKKADMLEGIIKAPIEIGDLNSYELNSNHAVAAGLCLKGR